MNSDFQQHNWINKKKQQSVLQVPLQFNFQPIEIISKQLTKLKGSSPYRIYYLGPRWNNSYLFHKMFSQKHGYDFDIFKINRNSTFFSQTMSQNQFYRNQLYYRAFEGMNPTIQNIDAVFDSKFEGGNLDCAIKVNQNQFDLFLRIDSNTRGHIFWYNFTVSNVEKGSKLKFNICNFTKHKTLYQLGLKPFVRILNNEQIRSQWSANGIENVTFSKKKLRYHFLYEKIKVRQLYELSFQYTFQQPTDKVQFSYCIPYGYTDLCNQLKTLRTVAEIQTLGKSLTGINIPVIKIGKINLNKPKPVIFVTGRVHPSETNGSIKLSGFMQYLCFSPQAQFLRNNVITIIIPMLNPDGVILGNSRAGACGKDLNREFRSKNKHLYPQISMVKQLIENIQKTHEIQLYLDFHGHSRKKNIFFFGPQYTITQMQYYKARMIPKILANITSIFRYYSCSYSLSEQKKNTARGVMLSEYQIPFVYTVESSIGVYHDFSTHKDVLFNRKIWEFLGESIGAALGEYFDSLNEYQKFIQARKTQKSKNVSNRNNRLAQIEQKKFPNIQKHADIKILRMLTQIKKLDENFNKKNNHGNESDGQSDSQDQEDNLERQKMKEFQGMVTEFADQQSRKKNDTFREHKLEPSDSRKLYRRKIKTNTKDNLLLNDIWKQAAQFRYHSKSSQRRNRQFKSFGKELQYPKKKSEDKLKDQHQGDEIFSRQKIEQPTNSKEFLLISPLAQPKLDENNSNMTYFNLSKILQNNKVVRYQVDEAFHTLQNKVKKAARISQSAHFELNPTKMNQINLFEANPIIENNDYDEQQISNRKSKNAYPVSFYRIKYHQVSTKKNRKKKYEEYKELNETKRQLNSSNWPKIPYSNRSISLSISQAHS